MRAFRPSRFGVAEEVSIDPAHEVERVVKMKVYAKRAQAREPLFEEKVESDARLLQQEG
jgi:hypothetical protein